MKWWPCIIVAGLTSACYSDQPLEVEANFDFEQLEGTWYEVAKLPRASEQDCTHTTVTYERTASHQFEMRTRCNLQRADGPLHTAEAKVVLPDIAEPAKLALDFGFYMGEHWVLELGSNPDYVVVGHPSRQYLWILSRTPRLSSHALSSPIQHARDLGFDVDELEFTEQ